jgi:hypothetical protein
VPREAPTKQPDFLLARTTSSWTSRLADGPAAAAAAALPPPGNPGRSPAAAASPNAFAAAAALRPDSPGAHAQQLQRPGPQQPQQQGSAAQRLTEALQQGASAPGAADRTRLEQLAVKQSQKLIPVMALPGKSKAGGGVSARPGPAAGLTPLGKPAPSAQRAAFLAPPGGPALLSLAAPSAAAAAAPASGLLTLRLSAPAAGRRKGGAGSFFESLRRRGSASDQSQQAREEDDLAAAVSELVGLRLVGLSASAQLEEQQRRQSPCAGGGLASPGSGSQGGDGPLALLGPSAEEEAFLRSLGWTEASDEEGDGGLTEEEISAFRAAAELRGRLPSLRPKPPAMAAQRLGLACGCSGCSSSDESDTEF